MTMIMIGETQSKLAILTGTRRILFEYEEHLVVQ